MEENRIQKKILPEIELDLMDWKAVEKQSEDAIREALTTIKISEEVRREAKFQIKKWGGLPSEEERAAEKKNRGKCVLCGVWDTHDLIKDGNFWVHSHCKKNKK